MTRPLRVLAVLPHAARGGQEEWLLQLVGATRRLQVETLLLQDGPMRAVLEERGLPVEVMPVGRRPRDLAAPIARLTARLRLRPPEVVVANGVKAQFVAGPAARLAGVPSVFVRHDHSFESLVAHLARLSDAVVGTTAEVLEAVGRPGAVVIEPPLPSSTRLDRTSARRRLERLGLPAGEHLVLGMCTRLVAYKGVDDAVVALAHEGNQAWHLVVLGASDPAEPHEASRLRALATRLGVTDRVHLLGFVPEASSLLPAFDAVAVLTKTAQLRGPGREGFGMVALEAMVAGVPVIAVAGGAIERRLSGRAGIAVPMADPVAVAEALGHVADASVRDRLGRAAQELVRRHPTAEASAQRFAGVLAEAARRPGAGLEPSEPVSVVVPVHDEVAVVRDLVQHLSAQTRPGDELVVVDDASTDGTLETLRDVVDGAPAVTVVALQRNRGAAGARNAGVLAARHRSIVCTDAGVHQPQGWLDAMRTALEDEPRPDLVSGAWEVTKETALDRAMAVAVHQHMADARSPRPFARAYTKVFGRTFDSTRPAGRSMAFTRSAFDRVGGFPEQLRAREDVTFGLAVARGGRTVLQLEAPVLWRQHSTLDATVRMYFAYGRGDGLAGERLVVARNGVRAAAVLLSPVLVVAGGPWRRSAVALGTLAYLGVPVSRLRGEPHAWRSALLVPLAVVAKDVPKAAGCLVGLVQARRRSTVDTTDTSAQAPSFPAPAGE